MQHLYQRFQPAQFSNYKAPQRILKGAVSQNITFAQVTQGRTDPKSVPKQQKSSKTPINKLHQHSNQQPQNQHQQQHDSWSDEIPPNMNEARLFDNNDHTTSESNITKGTKEGGSMHANNDEDFKAFIKNQFKNLEENLNILMTNLAFTINRIESIEQTLNIKVITPNEADTHNLNAEEMDDEIEPSINSSASTIVKQQKIIDGLRSINEMHQSRLTSFTTTVNTLAQSCVTFQNILIKNNLLPQENANNIFPLGVAFDDDVKRYINELSKL
jgi:hypothetical protein